MSKPQVSKAMQCAIEHVATGLSGAKLAKHMATKHGSRFAGDNVQQFYPSSFRKQLAELAKHDAKPLNEATTATSPSHLKLVNGVWTKTTNEVDIGDACVATHTKASPSFLSQLQTLVNILGRDAVRNIVDNLE